MKIKKAIIAIVIMAACAAVMLTCGCTSRRPWESAEINCLQYANAATLAAFYAGYESGVVHCQRRGELHAVTWIDVDGERLYWDAAWSEYLTAEQVGPISLTTHGPSRGAFERIHKETP